MSPAGATVRTTADEITNLLRQQVNIALLVLACVAIYFTQEPIIVAYAIIFEIWYLALSLRRGPLYRFRNWMRGRMPAGLQQLKWQAMLSSLLIACGILYVVVFVGPITIAGRSIETPHERWEIAALTWNVIFTAIAGFWSQDHDHGFVQMVVAIFRAGVTLLLARSALESLARGLYMEHLWDVFYIALCFLACGLFEIWSHRKLLEEKKFYMTMSLVVDVFPALILFVLLLYSRSKEYSSDTSYFLSGALAVQFLACIGLDALVRGRVLGLFVNSAPVNWQASRSSSQTAGH